MFVKYFVYLHGNIRKHMVISVKDKLRALDILKGYNGNNPYILMLKRDVVVIGQ